MRVILIGTLDTKGIELDFVRQELHARGVATCLIDAGSLSEPRVQPDIPREEVFEAAGTTANAVRDACDRGNAVTLAATGVAKIVAALHAQDDVAGVLGIGGSAGTTIATAGMRALPIGVPKLMVSTLASGQVRPYVGNSDILMHNSIVDISGINRISRRILTNAALAMRGMVSDHVSDEVARDRPMIAASMFGVTTPCVERARQILEEAGFEVLVFHATGNGGQTMESLIGSGMISGVLDITTTELADELVGGTLSAGPDRMTAAGKAGIPQVISVGAMDMVNFGPRDTVPIHFADRKFHVHNATVTLMRTTPAENRLLGEEIGRKAAAAQGPTAILLPMQGVSAIDRNGQPFDDPAARAALFEGVRSTHHDVPAIEVNRHINDPEFAEMAAQMLIQMLTAQTESTA